MRYVIFVALFLVCSLSYGAKPPADEPKVQVQTLASQAQTKPVIDQFQSLADLVAFSRQHHTTDSARVLAAFAVFEPSSAEQIAFEFEYIKLLLDTSLADQALLHAQILHSQTLDAEQTRDLQGLFAQAYQMQGQLASAIEYYLKLVTTAPSTPALVEVLLHLSQLYFDLELFTEAENALQQSQQLITNSDDNIAKLEMGLALTKTVITLQKHDVAKVWLGRQIELANRLNLATVASDLTFRQARYLTSIDEFGLAQRLLEQLFNEGQKQRDVTRQYRALTELIYLLLESDDIQQATELVKPAERLAVRIYSEPYKRRFYYVKAIWHAKSKQYNQALQLMSELVSHTDWYDPWFDEQQDILRLLTKWRVLAGGGDKAWQSVQTLEQVMASEKQQLHEAKLNYWQVHLQKAQVQLRNEQAERITELANQEQYYRARLKYLKNGFLLITFIALLVIVGILIHHRKALRNVPLRTHFSQFPGHAQWISCIYQWRQSNQSFSILMFDFDGLARLNEQLGHMEVDKILTAKLQAIAHRLNGKHELYYLGANLFSVLARDYTDKQALVLAEVLAKELQFTIRNRNSGYGAAPLCATFAVQADQPTRHIEQIKQTIITTIAKAKQRGGDSCQIVPMAAKQ